MYSSRDPNFTCGEVRRVDGPTLIPCSNKSDPSTLLSVLLYILFVYPFFPLWMLLLGCEAHIINYRVNYFFLERNLDYVFLFFILKFIFPFRNKYILIPFSPF